MTYLHEQNEGNSLGRAEFLARSAVALGALVGVTEFPMPARAESNGPAAELIHQTDVRWSKMLREITEQAKHKNPNVTPSPFTALSGDVVHQYVVKSPKVDDQGLHDFLTLIVPQKDLGPEMTIEPETLISTFIDQTNDPKSKSHSDVRFELGRYPASSSEAYAIFFYGQNMAISADGKITSLSAAGNRLPKQDRNHKAHRNTLGTSFEEAKSYLESYMTRAESIVKDAKN